MLQAAVQGDREDRIRIRQQVERNKKRAEAQQAADELALMPRRMAGEGATEADICAALERQRVCLSVCLTISAFTCMGPSRQPVTVKLMAVSG